MTTATVATTAFALGGYNITWVGLLAVAATLQLIAFATWSGSSKAKFAKSGMRKCDLALLLSGVAFLAIWSFAFDANALIREVTTPAAVSQASMTSTREVKPSCASLQNGMTIAQVRKKVGAPDQVIKEEDVRGPGAQVWIYTDRCAAHVFEGQLEFVE